MPAYKRRLLLFTIFLLPLIFIFSQCLNFNKTADDPRGKEYAGAAACVSCHRDISNSSLHTAHFMASQPANDKTIDGSFANGANELVFNPHIKAVMEKRDTGFFQNALADGKIDQSQRFDIVFGGVKGQSYAYWFANMLFQLPVSTANHQWINSPGYEPGRIAFERPVSVKCLDCHLSYAKSVPSEIPNFYSGGDGFEKNSLVLSIDCERCHGPAAAHVKFQTDNPTVKAAKFITRFSSLSREQKINMCAICHSGAGSKMLKPTFGFKPGDTIGNYMAANPNSLPLSYENIDVHGNQKALLASSKCFVNSLMDCSTCHNTHVNDRDNILLYAARCITCHNQDKHVVECKMIKKLSAKLLTANCIACHMPAFSSHTIIAGGSGALVHTHHIGIYPDETQKILSYINTQKPK